MTRKNEEPFDEVFGDVFGEIHEIMGSVMGSLRQETGGQKNSGMHIDVQEIGGEIIVTADLQGFEKEEIYLFSSSFCSDRSLLSYCSLNFLTKVE